MTEQPRPARDRGQLRGAGHEATAPAHPPAPTLAASLGRVVAWAAAYAAATWLGHRTVIGGSGFALFWPASGVALAWIASARDRTRTAELALVGAIGCAASYLQGGTTWESVDALVGAPLGLGVFVATSRRWAPGLWGTGGAEQVATLRDYGRLMAAALLAGVTETLVAVFALLPDPGQPFERTGEIGITHTLSMATVGVTLLIVGGWWAALPAGPWPQRVLAGMRRDGTRRDVALAGFAATFVLLVFLAGYEWFTNAPVSFVLVMAVVAIGVRFSAVTTGAFALAITAVACWLTAVGQGPIAGLPEPHRRALAFGLFMFALVVTGLTVSLSRRERDATIAQLRESERAAEVLADDLTVVLASLEEGVAVVEEGGRFIHINAAIGRLLQMPDFNAEQVVPVDTYHLVHPDGRPLLESEVPHVRAFAGEEDVHATLHLARTDGRGERIFEVGSRLLPQIRATDKPRAVTTIRDVTDEHLQRDALSSFAQTVAHDLRNPLTSVDLWARELLESYEEGPVSPETGAMMAGHIHAAAGRMQNFISDLLAYALSRDQTPSPIRLELTDVVESVIETIAAVEGDAPDIRYEHLPEVWCDPVLVPQLFDNLIGNARKYVAEDVVPTVRIEATSLPEDWVRVRVLDNGIGVAPEDRARVFETFERARPQDYDGTGLGLAICRHIVERHGGTIAITSPPDGVGTCVEMTLPASDAAFVRATSIIH